MSSNTTSTVYLIPSSLADGVIDVMPAYIAGAVKDCSVIFAENERTARRFFKSIWKEMPIDDYEWFTIHKAEAEQLQHFRNKISEGKNIGIISEAGCPGIADPGQVLIEAAQQLGVRIKPLVGPNSIIMALMASGMNGQQFEFVGYLPIDSGQRAKAIKDLENDSAKHNSTKIFIETPYRNNQLIETIVKTCGGNTKLCIAVDITDSTENIQTKTITDWRKQMPDIHKRPAIFLLQA